MGDYEDRSADDLREEARRRGLSETGNKGELAARLRENDAATTTATAGQESPAQAQARLDAATRDTRSEALGIGTDPREEGGKEVIDQTIGRTLGDPDTIREASAPPSSPDADEVRQTAPGAANPWETARNASYADDEGQTDFTRKEDQRRAAEQKQGGQKSSEPQQQAAGSETPSTP